MKGKVKVEFENEEKRFAVKAGNHVVIATGKAACKTALPTRAGLNTLYPNPPKINLPSPMAIMPPQKAIQRGKLGGSVSPNNKPVITADQSAIVLSFLENLQR